MGADQSNLQFKDTYENCTEAAALGNFLHQYDIATLEQLFEEIEEASTDLKCRLKSLRDKNSADALIQWTNYFNILTKLKENAEKKRIKNFRAKLHTAAYGYMMERVPVDYSALEPLQPEKLPEESPPIAKKEVEDDYTEDDPSVFSDSDLEEHETDTEDEEDDDEEDDDDAEENEEEEEGRRKGGEGSQDGDKEEKSLQKVSTKDEKDDSTAGGGGVAAKTGGKGSGFLQKAKDAKGKNAKEESKKDSDKVFKKTEKIPRVKARHINPSIVNPVFFGYSLLTQHQVETEQAAARAALEAREKKSLDEAKKSRESNIEKQEKYIKTQTDSRKLKIAEMTSKYEASQKGAEETLKINQEDMPANSFRQYQIQWEIDQQVAKMAYEEELKNLIEIDRVKTEFDSLTLVEFNNVMEALKDAQAQQVPSAEALEGIAKEEINRFILNLEDAKANLQKTRTDYFIVRKELEDKVAKIEGGSSKKIPKEKVQELRSMLNVSENRFKQAQKEIENLVANLRDAEVLLQMALKMKERQDEVRPLYDSLMKGNKSDNPKAYPPIKQIDFLICTTAYMKGNFEEKLRFLLKILKLDDKDDFYSYSFLVSLIFQVQSSLFKMGLYPEAPNELHVLNFVSRYFQKLELNIGIDYLSEYEFKNFIEYTCSGSRLIIELFGISVHKNLDIGTYQRNNMNPVALFQVGMISQETLYYRYHHATSRYKACLAPKNKFHIHERALSMGMDDPMKADYSKLIVAEAKTEKNKMHTEPLLHGHIMYSNWQKNQFRNQAALFIQRVYRSFRDRKFAELSAKFQAFNEARLQSIREMKAKIVKEFQARENSTGMGKMKWDAKVRMVQAKLKLQNMQQGGAAALVGGGGGAGTSRNDAVMVLLEEAIATVKEEIEKRFLELQTSEDFAGIDFEKLQATRDARFVTGRAEEKKLNTSSAINVNENDNGIMGMLGIPAKPKIEDAALMIMDGSENSDGKKDPGDKAMQERKADQEQLQALKNEMIAAILEGSYGKPQPEHMINHNSNSKKMNKFKKRGEFITEKLLRLAMFNSEPDPMHLKNRLRSIHKTCTLYKIDALLMEIPSKRLLIRYVEHQLSLEVDNSKLVEELANHFKFEKSSHKLAHIFEDMCRSDSESGTLLDRLKDLQYKLEMGIYDRLKEIEYVDLEKLREQVKRRVESNAMVNDVIIVKDEYSRAQLTADKFRKGLKDMIKELIDWRDRYKKVKLACNESERKLMVAKKLHCEIVDNKILEMEIIHDERINWMKRLTYALHMPEDKIDLRERKYYEIRAVCKEFLATVESDAINILNEHKLPNYKKTIPAIAEYKCHGRNAMTGRGFDGTSTYYSYELHNVTYIVIEDYNGIFNGSDEFAMKASGKDRLNSLEYFKVHVDGLHVPLTATYDFCGYRVFCQAKLPTDIVLYNDDGEVRKISESVVYGINKDGDNFINKNKILNNMLRAASSRLNLAQHEVKGMKDIVSNSTYASSDIKGYKGHSTAEFYIKDFWRAMPAELPEYTPHLTRTPRDHSVFWRQLRPEFVRNFPKALSPDANSIISSDVKDFKQHIENLENATKYLVEDTIPEYSEYLANKEYFLPISEGLGMNVSEEFHIRGINLRHMGFIRSLLWRKLPGKVNIFYRESAIRSSRDLREEVAVGDKISCVGKQFTIVPDNVEYKFTYNTIPTSDKYLNDSFNGVDGFAGRVSMVQNSGDFDVDLQATLARHELVSTTLLCEMIARTVKNMIRVQLRQYVSRTKITSYQFMLNLLVDYMNVMTGAHKNSHEILEESIYENVRLRFGNWSIRPSERNNLHHTIRPATKFLIKRLQLMFGIQLSTSCLAEFYNRPANFIFVFQDIVQCQAVIKHNIPIIAFADAMLLSCKATYVETLDYYQEVLSEKPVIFFKLSERKGCRELVNHGFLGSLLTVNLYSTKSQPKDSAIITGYVSPGCECESPGPIEHDPFSRAVSFKPINKAYIESKFHPMVVPLKMAEPFSVELWARVTGAVDNTRTLLMCGRFAFMASRDNCFTFIFMNNMYEVSFRVGVAELHKWTHLMATYDGTTLKCFYNGVETISAEVEILIQMQEEQAEQDFKDRLDEINEEEESEKRGVKEKTIIDAEKYFLSKEGIGNMKRACQNIMDSQDFQALGIGNGETNESQQLKMKKIEAMKQAKNMYVTDKYTINVKPTVEKFKALVAETVDRRQKDIDDGIFRGRRGLRLGSIVTAGTSREGKNFFFGELSCVAVYNRYLSVDRVKAHYFSATLDIPKDAQRFHALASSKYEEALSYSIDDVMMLRGYASSLCDYLKIEVSEVTAEGISKGKIKIMNAIDEFTWRRVPEGIAEILSHLPKEPHHADVVVKGMKCIFQCDKNFFIKGVCLTRKDLVDIPRIFSLDQPGNSMDQISCAASIYREVSRETELRLVYGQLNLGWINQIKSDELVVALVRHAIEDKTLSMIRISEMFGFAFGRRQHVNILDDDVEILTHNVQECKGIDFSNCTKLTDNVIRMFTHIDTIRIIILDYCSLISDKMMKLLWPFGDQLECLSFQQCQNLSDVGLAPLFEKCSNLFTVNLNGVANITDESLVTLAKHNTRLKTLHISGTQLTDQGLSVMANYFNKKSMTSLDISMCRNVADFGLISVSQAALNLTYINICGVNKLTDIGCQKLCANCFYLTQINMEDLYLLLDRTFFFDKVGDGRMVADESMLKSVTYLNLTDCVNITDECLRGLAIRCRRVSTLILKGCDRLTNKGLEYLTKNFEEKIPFCDSLRVLDLSFCGSVNIEGMKVLLPACGVLEEVRFNGISTVNDEFIEYVCRRCNTLLRFIMQKCVFLTDNSMCHFADYLWIEQIDLTNNHRISDLGIEILVIACNGMLNMNLSGLRNLTDRSINAMFRNCKLLHTLNVTGCDRLSARAINRLKDRLPSLEVIGFKGDKL